MIKTHQTTETARLRTLPFMGRYEWKVSENINGLTSSLSFQHFFSFKHIQGFGHFQLSAQINIGLLDDFVRLSELNYSGNLILKHI